MKSGTFMLASYDRSTLHHAIADTGDAVCAKEIDSMQRWIARGLRCGGIALLSLAVSACGALATTPPPTQGSGSASVTQPYPTPGTATPLYQASLATATAGWATDGSTSPCTFANGGLTVSPMSGQAYICLAPMTPASDMAVTVTVRQLSGPPTHGYGIAFRHTVPKSYYFFGINGQQRFTLTIVTNDVSQTVIPFTLAPAINASGENQLRVIMRGQVATLFVNNSAVGQATLTAFAQGVAGLRGVNDGTVVFRDLVVAPL